MESKRDLHSYITPAISLPPAARTATANGTEVDRRGFNSATVVVTTGAITDGTHAITLQHRHHNGAWENVPADQLAGSLPTIGAANDNVAYVAGYLGNRRYLRVVTTVAGATTGGVYGANIVLSHPRAMGSAF